MFDEFLIRPSHLSLVNRIVNVIIVQSQVWLPVQLELDSLTFLRRCSYFDSFNFANFANFFFFSFFKMKIFFPELGLRNRVIEVSAVASFFFPLFPFLFCLFDLIWFHALNSPQGASICCVLVAGCFCRSLIGAATSSAAPVCQWQGRRSLLLLLLLLLLLMGRGFRSLCLFFFTKYKNKMEPSMALVLLSVIGRKMNPSFSPPQNLAYWVLPSFPWEFLVDSSCAYVILKW